MFPTDAPVILHDVVDVAGLVQYLRNESRTRPVAVLTVAKGERAPYVSASELLKSAGGAVDVITIPQGDLSEAMAHQLEDEGASVHRGACRIYPPGREWERQPFTTPVRHARSRADGARLHRDLMLDIKHAQSRPVAGRAPASSHVGGAPLPVVPREGATSPPPPAGITTATEAEQLATFLHSSSRRFPAVVVSRATEASEAYADVEELISDLEGLATVFEICTVEASWAFSDAVPPRCQVYGGAARVYPLGTAWESDPYVSPLHFAHSRADRIGITRVLIGDVMRMASTSESLAPITAKATPLPVAGEVLGIIAERALVSLGGSQQGVLWPELVEPDIPAEQLFAKGMRIEGLLDPESKRIDVGGMRRRPEEALSSYCPGDTVLVKVTSVTAEACQVTSFPGRTHTITAVDLVGEETDVRGVLSEGEVLVALLVEIDAEGSWLLSLAEVDEIVVPAPAPSILVGGPPWLLPPDPSTNETADAAPAPPQTVVEESVKETGAAEAGPSPDNPRVAALQREKMQLVNELEEEHVRRTGLEADLKNARAQLRRAKKRKGGGAEQDDSGLFEDPAEQLEFEIRLAWARMTLPSEKKELPLKQWTFGSDFLMTLNDVEGVSRDKIVEVIVHVLTGRDAELHSRELHPLRSGLGGNNAKVVRDRGEICWRVSLQSNAPAARRLHYWSGADGSVELSSVRVHDDYRP